MKAKLSIMAMVLIGLLASPTSADTTSTVGNIQSMNLYLTIGYYFHIENQGPMVLTRKTDAKDPFRTYAGCRTTKITSNFDVVLINNVKATSAAGGKWSATTKPSAINKGTTKVEICVQGEDLQIENLRAGTEVKVAEIRIGVIAEGT